MCKGVMCPKVIPWSGIETVTYVTDREDAATFRAELTQTANVDVDRTRLQIRVLAGSPYRFEERIPAQDATVRHQKRAQ